MAPAFDAIIVGLGAAGSAVAYHLAAAGRRVLALEAHGVPHDKGSSHGGSRIIRFAYREGAAYVPLLLRSAELFRGLEEEAAAALDGDATLAAHAPPAPSGRGRRLFMRTGSLDVGAGAADAAASARQHGLRHELLSGPDLARRFPGYAGGAHAAADAPTALFQPDGGVLFPEAIVAAHVALAVKRGAVVRTGQDAVRWAVDGGGVAVTTAAGETHRAAQLVLAAGPWMPALVPQLARVAAPERQFVAWFGLPRAVAPHFSPHAFPVFVLDDGDAGGDCFYGFPELPGQPGEPPRSPPCAGPPL
jgi:sarcosine oxidase